MGSKKRVILVAALVTGLLFLMVIPGHFQNSDDRYKVLITNFNQCEKPIQHVQDWGSFPEQRNRYGVTKPPFVQVSCIEDPVHPEERKEVIRIKYDVTKEASFSGFRLEIINLDREKFNVVDGKLIHDRHNAIRFYMRGDEEEDFTTTLRIDLKIKGLGWFFFYVTTVTTQWQKFTIPFDQFEKAPYPWPPEGKPNKLDEFTITFENNKATQKKGVIYFDKLSLIKESILLTGFNHCAKEAPVINWGSFSNGHQGQALEECIEDPLSEEERGKVIKIDYDVQAPNSFSGFWLSFELPKLDPSILQVITFHIRGGMTSRFTKKLKVELKLREGNWGWRVFYLDDITDTWQVISIPLRSFKKIREWSDKDEFVITFENTKVTAKRGTIFIDNISFEP